MVLGLAVALATAALLPSTAFAEADSLCGPFVAQGAGNPIRLAAADVSESMSMRETGVVPSGAAAGGLLSPGQIVQLPAAVPNTAAGSGTQGSEAILALPKDASGKISEDFELGPGAEIRESFFSPVICATVARIAGPAGASIEQLVTVLPDGSALVANDVYASAASEASGLTEIDVPAQPDPYASLQYGLAISGVREVREVTSGEGVIIALLDSAPEENHRDLTRPEPTDLSEGEHPVGVHGTLMAGVITAIEGNGFGIAGLAPGATLVPIPICTPSGRAGGRCTIFQILKGLDQAWKAEAHIVNLSLSGPPNILLERGVARLEELGAVVVAAAGNEGTDEKRYPAAYPTVIGVGAIDREGRPFESSNRGSWVELGAPGVNVLSTIPGNAFAFGNGTSLSAAHVTGVLAIVTGVTRDPKRARAEMFRAAHAAGKGRTPPVTSVCEIFARLPEGEVGETRCEVASR